MTAYGATQGGSNLTSTTVWRISKREYLQRCCKEQRNTALTEFITSAMLYARLYWCWMFLWCWRVAVPCYRCWLTGHQKTTEEAQMSKTGKYQHVTRLCLFTLKPWAEGSLSLFACKGNSKAIHPSSLSLRKEVCLSPWKHLTTPKTIWHTEHCVRKLPLWGLLHHAHPLQHFPLSL